MLLFLSNSWFRNAYGYFILQQISIPFWYLFIYLHLFLVLNEPNYYRAFVYSYTRIERYLNELRC